MKFKTEAERLAHPKAKLIPQSMWIAENLFNFALKPHLLMLMDDVNIEELLSRLKEIATAIDNELDKKLTWLVIALSRPLLEYSKLDEIKCILDLTDIAHFQVSATLGNMAYLNHFLQGGNETEIVALIKQNRYAAYRYAAEHGHLEIVKLFEAKASAYTQQMIKAGSFDAYRGAAYNGFLEVCLHILNQSSECLAYIYGHDEEFGTPTMIPFIHAKLSALHQDELNQPANALFDITDAEQAKICFLIIKNLISLNERPYDDEIRFLLNIPSVHALAHVSVNEGPENELLRLATRIGNTEASSILLNIPAVRQLAEHNGYYEDEARGGLNLRDLARDCESSLTALTVGELRRLDSLTKAYNPRLEAAGAPQLIDELRLQLMTRYEKNPATIAVDGKIITLPIVFADFNNLKLNDTQRRLALEAYYKHKDHTAWRYLLKPNPWMNPRAEYVDENENGRFSTFEEYQPLIAMLWLGAIDETIPPIDGHTLEGRLEHFIDELAHIGRAHNWDRTRDNPTTGKPEEYDDLTGDRPSCFSGVKRRLFQSLLGHPLITRLTPDILLDEVRDFANTYFKNRITPENIAELIDAYDDNIMEEPPECLKPLACLNIPLEELQTFELGLAQKYGESYTQDPGLRRVVTNRLTLNTDSPSQTDHYHALKLESLVRFHQQLVSLNAPSAGSPASGGFFAGGSEGNVSSDSALRP